MTPHEVAGAVARHLTTDRQPMTADTILNAVRGVPAVTRARWLTAWVWRRLSDPPISLTKTGRAFDRDRTSIKHGEERLQTWVVEHPDFGAAAQATIAELGLKLTITPA